MTTRDEYVASIKSAFAAVGKDVVLKALLQKIPMLSFPILNPIVTYLVGWMISLLLDNAETGLFFLYIDMRVDVQAKDFEAAAYENRKAQLSGTPEEKALAEKKLKIAFSKFIRLTN